ncbi:hypothetical protein [Ciceribacter selenitireducens]|jgi:hypothetical protein|uniref:Uncharacterized protein n=1 Tax=Ciceribacter selenitireducens ATCC BAA-1503 TaxID=1336235 RepID=A0A376AKR6_9HYPH|nr:hypothetical protein [Ciceribacter selenitireducens]SSC68270.1 unnamed protein product [Ciceribacter selenitireducens ATCC BAA-1503]
MIEAGHGQKPWSSLADDERDALQAAYQAELDKEPPTCSLEAKVERFARWLATQGVAFSMDDLNAKR